MKGMVNSQLLATTKVRSTAISALGVICHPMTEAGEYRGAVVRGDAEVAELSVSVDERYSADQADLDVSGIQTPFGAKRREVRLEVRPGGYLVIHASARGTDAHVVLREEGAKGKKARDAAAFDSRRLGPGDLLAATLLRPGMYTLSDSVGGGRGSVRVSYPVVGDAPASIEPVSAKVTKGSFEPAEITVTPGQPIVFAIQRGETAIMLELAKPDNGPKTKVDERRARRHERWARDRERRQRPATEQPPDNRNHDAN